MSSTDPHLQSRRSVLSWFPAFSQADFDAVINIRNYRHSAFKAQINSNTSVLESLHIFATSNIRTDAESEAFWAVRRTRTLLLNTNIDKAESRGMAATAAKADGRSNRDWAMISCRCGFSGDQHTSQPLSGLTDENGDTCLRSTRRVSLNRVLPARLQGFIIQTSLVPARLVAQAQGPAAGEHWRCLQGQPPSWSISISGHVTENGIPETRTNMELRLSGK